MADQGQNDPVKDKQDSAMPTEEQKTTDNASQQEVATKVEPEKAGQEGVSELPEDSKERTREQFEKLKEQLREEKEARRRIEGLIPQVFPQQIPQEPQVTPVYDPETGLLNEDVFVETQKAAQEARERAIRAEQAALRAHQELEARETFQTHPELNPRGDKFDKELYVEARRIWNDSVFHPEDYGLDPNLAGTGITFKQAADIAKAKRVKPQEAKQEEQAEQVQGEEQQAPQPEAEGTPQRANELLSSEEEELAYQSRKGVPGAMARRLAIRRQKQVNP